MDQRKESHSPLLLRNAHVLDAAQGIDGVCDVLINDGKIAGIGALGEVPGASVIDLAGKYLSAGWVDIHVHTYGTLGFSTPDSIGVYQGVTSFVDAGGAGIGVMDEFEALMTGLHTSLYAGPFVRPLGLIGLNFLEGDVRSLGNVPIDKWIDYMKRNGDVVRYLKCNAMGDFGPGSLKISKGLAEIVGIPLYMHIGEFQQHVPEHILATEAFRIAQAGDMITHIYHGNLGRIVDEKGQVLPEVKDAQQRGVLFDLGFGGYNFSWDVAEKAFAQGIYPHTISSDLQQFNVIGPVKSLANVMGAMLALGMPLEDVVERVTYAAAKAISLTDRAGSLAVGMPADVTVFEMVQGTFEISDCHLKMRPATREIRPLMAFKNGMRFDCDLAMAQSESNWLLQFAEDFIPEKASHLSSRQLDFLEHLRSSLAEVQWHLSTTEPLDYDKALVLQVKFHEAKQRSSIELADALTAVYNCFVEEKFTLQIGLFLMCLGREHFFERIDAITAKEKAVA